MWDLIEGDCLDALRALAVEGAQFDACVTDPPYHLTSIVKRFGGANAAPAQFGTDGVYARASAGFMGKQWDGGDIAFRPETWRLVYDVLAPGAYLLCFGGTRTFHRVACAIEDAGFEIRDCVMWMYGSGFPKSHNLDGDWVGWGSALKPAWEPVLVCAKPLTVTQHIAICIEAITELMMERFVWSGWIAHDVAQSFSDILAKSNEVARSVLDDAKMRSLASIGLASCAANHFTYNWLELKDWKETKEHFVLSHVKPHGSGGARPGQTTLTGEAAGILTRITGIYTSVMLENTSENIVSSWRSISDDLLSAANRFTTETAIKLTTALRTLSCSLLPNTIEDTGCLRPNWEPVIVARKPLIGTIAENVLRHGTGAMNIDACRVPVDPDTDASQLRTMQRGQRTEDTAGQVWGLSKNGPDAPQVVRPDGRWPANVIHDGSDEVMEAFAVFGEKTSGKPGVRRKPHETHSMSGRLALSGQPETGVGDSGSAARFFYCAKATKTDRADSKHPTVKPIALLRYLTRLVTPPGGAVLDPFAGSGTTLQAAAEEGFLSLGIEREADYCADIRRRMQAVTPKRHAA